MLFKRYLNRYAMYDQQAWFVYVYKPGQSLIEFQYEMYQVHDHRVHICLSDK